MTGHVLFYYPGACSLAPHVALREAGLPFELERVDLRGKHVVSGGDYRTVNPKGYVPALRLPHSPGKAAGAPSPAGGEVLTECQVILQYIADQAPAAKLAPNATGMARYRFAELLNFIATELHKGLSPLYSPVATAEYKHTLKLRLASRWEVLAGAVRGPYLLGEQFTIADAYATYSLHSWRHTIKESLAPWPALVAYQAQLAARPSVAAAIAAEELAP
jgi:glutathione S-transferase